jgi:hypothetical protein
MNFNQARTQQAKAHAARSFALRLYAFAFIPYCAAKNPSFPPRSSWFLVMAFLRSANIARDYPVFER